MRFELHLLSGLMSGCVTVSPWLVISLQVQSLNTSHLWVPDLYTDSACLCDAFAPF